MRAVRMYIPSPNPSPASGGARGNINCAFTKRRYIEPAARRFDSGLGRSPTRLHL
jgi:hypothetical protein